MTPRNKDNPKNNDNLENKENIKNADDLKMQMIFEMKMTSKMEKVENRAVPCPAFTTLFIVVHYKILSIDYLGNQHSLFGAQSLKERFH